MGVSTTAPRPGWLRVEPPGLEGALGGAQFSTPGSGVGRAHSEWWGGLSSVQQQQWNVGREGRGAGARFLLITVQDVTAEEGHSPAAAAATRPRNF